MNKEKYLPSKEAEEILDGCRLMDDDFMTRFFDGNHAAMQLVLKIILSRTQIIIKKLQVQKVEKSPVPGGRTVYLDIFAVDSAGKNFDVEIQRAESGADFKRARFHSSVMDSRMLKAGEPFSALNESYMIFITETDVMGAGLPIYHVSRVIEELNTPFDDGNHIIYVNGAYRNNETDIGKLIHDFRCTRSSDMFYDILKDGMHYYKETEGGREIMCKAVEDFGNKKKSEGRIEGIREGRIQGKIEGIKEGIIEGIKEGKIEGIKEGKIETAKNMMAEGMGISFISKILKVPESCLKEWLA